MPQVFKMVTEKSLASFDC